MTLFLTHQTKWGCNVRLTASENLAGWRWSPDEAASERRTTTGTHTVLKRRYYPWILPINMLSHMSFVPSANIWLLLLYRFFLHPFVSLVTLTACLLLVAITHLSEVWQIVLDPQIHPHLSDLWVCVHVTYNRMRGSAGRWVSVTFVISSHKVTAQAESGVEGLKASSPHED